MTTDEKTNAAFELARHMIGVAQRAQEQTATTQAITGRLLYRWTFDMAVVGLAGIAAGLILAHVFPRLF